MSSYGVLKDVNITPDYVKGVNLSEASYKALAHTLVERLEESESRNRYLSEAETRSIKYLGEVREEKRALESRMHAERSEHNRAVQRLHTQQDDLKRRIVELEQAVQAADNLMTRILENDQFGEDVTQLRKQISKAMNYTPIISTPLKPGSQTPTHRQPTEDELHDSFIGA